MPLVGKTLDWITFALMTEEMRGGGGGEEIACAQVFTRAKNVSSLFYGDYDVH